MDDLLGRVAGRLGRLLDEMSPESGEARVLLMAAGVVLALVGLAWIRRISDPGSLTRGEARWRYRDRSLLGRLGEALTLPSLPGEGETRGWWITRVEFGIAITAVLVGPVFLFAWQPGPMIGGPSPGPLGLLPVAAYAGMWFGLWRMVRIYRAGLRNDAEATWRYRDRQS